MAMICRAYCFQRTSPPVASPFAARIGTTILVARSHGCVNVLPEAAQWFYRWTRPVTAYEDALLEVKEGGTQIVVM